MSIDGRKTVQSIINQHGLRIYIHKQSKDNYAVGINGTSQHKSGITKNETESYINTLIHVAL